MWVYTEYRFQLIALPIYRAQLVIPSSQVT